MYVGTPKSKCWIPKNKIKKRPCRNLVMGLHLLTHRSPLTVQGFLWPSQHAFTDPIDVHTLQLRPLKHILHCQVLNPKNQHAKTLWWVPTYSTVVPMTTTTCLYPPNSRSYLSTTSIETHHDENQIKEAFINEGRGHSPSHLKFFLLIFSKLKEDIK